MHTVMAYSRVRGPARAINFQGGTSVIEIDLFVALDKWRTPKITLDYKDADFQPMLSQLYAQMLGWA